MKKGVRAKINNLKWVLLIALALAANSFGAKVELTVNPPIISLGEAAQLKVEIRDTKNASAPNFPRIDGLNYSGISQSSQTTNINGKVDKSISYAVNVYPQETGEFKIGPFDYTIDGETKSLSGTLKVVASSNDSAAAQSWDDLVFAKITSNRQKVYVQEPFELTLSIYSRVGVQILDSINLQGMPTTGLTTESEWQNTSTTREKINNEIYEVRHFKTSMKALGSGNYNFAPSVTVQVVAPRQQQQQNDPRDIFGFGFSMLNRVETRPVEVKAKPLDIDVLPLPTAGKPANFSGAVGNFTFKVEAEPTEVFPGDPITLQITIAGDSNYDQIKPPTLPTDAPFRLFGDTVRKKGNNGIRFEQVISPKDESIKEIPAIEFSFFDSATGAYRTISSAPIPITVNASSNKTAQVFVNKDNITTEVSETPFASQSDIQQITKWLKRQWKIVRPWTWTIPTVLFAVIALLGVKKFRRMRRKDVARIRRQKAPKAARQNLAKASHALKNSDVQGFYNALWGALTDYFGNRLNLPAGNITLEKMTATLKKANLPDQSLDTLKQLFNAVDHARYGAPTNQPDTHEMERLKQELICLIKAVEKAGL